MDTDADDGATTHDPRVVRLFDRVRKHHKHVELAADDPHAPTHVKP